MKTLRFLIVLLAQTFLSLCISAQTVDKSIADPPGKATLISDQFIFTEGPVWIEGKGLVFSDIQANTMYLWNEKSGVTLFRKPSGYANGNALDRKGNLITAQHNRIVTRTDRNGKVDVIAKTFNDKKFNSPNDLVVRSDNSIYFSDPHYGITYAGFGPEQAEQEQPVKGIYRILPDGEIELASGEIEIPNGLAFSPDESLLYVCNMGDGNIYVFDADQQGNLSNPRLFAEVISEEGVRRVADGIKTDMKGNVYVATSSGLLVYSSEASLLGKIDLGGATPTNLNWGEDGKKLFITARDKLFMIRTRIGIDPEYDCSHKNADVIALIGGKFHNHEYIYSAFMQHYVDDLGISVEFSIDRRDINSEKLNNYKALILFVDPVWYPFGYQPDKWNPQFRDIPPEIVSEPEVDVSNGKRVDWFTEQHGNTIMEYVANGGGLLLFHQSCIMAENNDAFIEVAGGIGLGHPPLRPFKVEILNSDHPVTKGVNDFVILDEQHYFEYKKEPENILARSINKDDLSFSGLGSSSASVWAHGYKKGRVCMLAPGHTFAVMRNPEFVKLQKNALRWVLRLL